MKTRKDYLDSIYEVSSEIEKQDNIIKEKSDENIPDKDNKTKHLNKDSKDNRTDDFTLKKSRESIDDLDDNLKGYDIHQSIYDIHNLFKPKMDTKSFSVYHSLYIKSYGIKKNWCVIKQSEISKLCNISLSSVRRSINNLINLGYISIIGDEIKKTRIYRVYLPHELHELTKMNK